MSGKVIRVFKVEEFTYKDQFAVEHKAIRETAEKFLTILDKTQPQYYGPKGPYMGNIRFAVDSEGNQFENYPTIDYHPTDTTWSSIADGEIWYEKFTPYKLPLINLSLTRTLINLEKGDLS